MRKWDRLQALYELTGATIVAVIATVPVLLLRDETQQQVVPVVLAVIIGVVAYLVERGRADARGQYRCSSASSHS